MTTPPSTKLDELARGTALARLADKILRHRRLVILFWVVMFFAGGYGASAVSDRFNFDFGLPGQPGYETSKKIIEQYGTASSESTSTVFLITAPDGQRIAADLPKINAAFDQLRNEQRAPRVTRFYDVGSTGDSNFVTADGRSVYAIGVLPLFTSFDSSGVSKDVTQSLQQKLPGYAVSATGLDELANANPDQGSGVLVETLLAGLGALAILAFVFASFLALLPLLIAAVSIVTTLLIVLLMTTFTDVSFVVQFLVSLVGLGVAIDYSLLLVTRWREERSKGAANEVAIRTAMATAGHAVLLSGLTVAVGLVALVALPVPSFRSIGYGGLLIPIVSVTVTLTLLPAILGGFGQRMDWPRIRTEGHASRPWTAWARGIVKTRWLSAFAGLAILLVCTIPVKDLKFGLTGVDALAKSGPAYDTLTQLTGDGVPRGILTPIEILVDRANAPGIVDITRTVPGIDHVYSATSSDNTNGQTTVLMAIPNTETVNSSNIEPVNDLKRALADKPGFIGLTGKGAVQIDYRHAVLDNTWLVLLIIVIFTFLLLVRAFHSVLLAVKALVLNALSLAATFGILTFMWQQGHFIGTIFDTAATGAITFWIPSMVFAFLFGLSMDYEVFILARMREEYDRTGDTRQAVVEGIGRTGRLVTSAALILFLSFASLASAPNTDIRVLATGLGIGILLDATVVRSLLLPSLVALFGKANWWMPVWLAKALRTELPPPPPTIDRKADVNV